MRIMRMPRAPHSFLERSNGHTYLSGMSFYRLNDFDDRETCEEFDELFFETPEKIGLFFETRVIL